MKNNNRHNKRKMAVAVLAGLVLTGLVGASAASLNGIRGASLGADAEDVISCDDDGVDVSYGTNFVSDDPATGTPDPDENGFFDVDSATVSGVNALCEGKDYEVVLLDDLNLVLGTATGTVELDTPIVLDATDDFDAAFTGLIDAEMVTGIAITISG